MVQLLHYIGAIPELGAIKYSGMTYYGITLKRIAAYSGATLNNHAW